MRLPAQIVTLKNERRELRTLLDGAGLSWAVPQDDLANQLEQVTRRWDVEHDYWREWLEQYEVKKQTFRGIARSYGVKVGTVRQVIRDLQRRLARWGETERRLQ